MDKFENFIKEFIGKQIFLITPWCETITTQRCNTSSPQNLALTSFENNILTCWEMESLQD